MNTASTRSARLRRLGAGSVAAVALLAATGCSAVSPIATGIEYSPSDGIVKDVDGIGLRNVGVVSTGEDEKGRVLGSVSNSTQQEADVTLDLSGGSAEVTVPAGETVSLEEEEHILDSTGAVPGAMIDGTLKTGSTETDVKVPVLSPTQKEYRDLAPGTVDEKEWTGHLNEETHHYGTEGH